MAIDPIVLVSATVLPLTLADAKQHCRVMHTNEDDTYLLDLIAAAAEYIRVRTEVSITNITYRLTMDDWPSGELELNLPYPPTVTATVNYYDEANTNQVFTDYTIRRCGNVESTIVLNPEASWPSLKLRNDAIRIDYTAGLATTAEALPATVRHAMRLLVGYWYDNRSAVLAGSISKAIEFSLESLLCQFRTGRYSGLAS